jgi:ATP-dependent Lon protease
LEVLDPEQNNTFVDHYLNIPFDLSKVVFIATANTTDTIPAPLLDRMEMIYLPGYTFEEKLSIARKYLLPKQEKAHGLLLGSVQMSDEVILRIAERYTRESGVRTLERHIAAVVRAKCVEFADKSEEAGVKSEPTAEEMLCTVELGDLEGILGIEPYSAEVASRKPSPGLVTGLAYTASGSGGILFIEATQMPGKGELKLTGKLGDVIKESAQIALSWVKSHAYKLGLVAYERGMLLDGVDVHIHLPEGATPKDGPSAGIALVTALVSLFSQRLVPTATAMTGEITLRGQVLPVGGIKEKVISAHRAGITRVIMPDRNRKDVEGDVPEKVRQDMEFVYVKDVGEVFQHVFGDKLSWQLGVDARL